MTDGINKMNGPEKGKHLPDQSIAKELTFNDYTKKSDNGKFNHQAVKWATEFMGMENEAKAHVHYLIGHPNELPEKPADENFGDKTEWSVSELYEAEFKDPIWTVDELIPTGLVSLAGHPKIGKSWLSLQLAAAVASGGKFLGRPTNKGKVLYLAFEDPPKRLKARLKSQRIPKDTQIIFKTEYRLMNEGGLDDLYIDIESENYKLVVIDTFGRSMGMIEVKDYAENVMALSPLQKLANRKGLTMLLVDHHSKLGSDNPILDLIGSIGKAGTFDTLIGLYRERGKAGAKLVIIGRDQEDKDLSIEWDGLLCSWENMGDSQSVFKGEVLAALRTLKQVGDLPTTKNLAVHMGADASKVSRALADLVGAGKARRLPRQGVEVPYEAI